MKLSISERYGVSAGVVAAGAGGFALAGLLVGGLTLRLNPHVHASARDSTMLLVDFLTVYGVVGLLLGIGAGLAVGVVGRLLGTGRVHRLMAVILGCGLAFGPLLWVAMMPDVGLAKGVLTVLLFSPSKIKQLTVAAGMGLAAVAFGWGFLYLLELLGTRLKARTSWLAIGVWVAAAAAIVAWSFVGSPRVEARPEPAASALPAVVEADPPPPPVVLLLIDGADLDDVILPLVQKGSLPAFAKLMREGAWGELATFEPTLSPVVWTTIITGKLPEQHGVHHFVNFRLPGVRQPIFHFPREAGLNTRIVPMLDRMSGLPALVRAYTSNMRTARTLWSIVGDTYNVGNYQWLITFPAEPLNGFNVAGGVQRVQFFTGDPSQIEAIDRQRNPAERLMQAAGRSVGPSSLEDALYPMNLFEGLPPLASEEPDWDAIRRYLGPTAHIDEQNRHVKRVMRSRRRATAHYLPLLIEKYQARFTAASFYSVDDFQHWYATARGGSARFSEAIDEAYKYTDARLGEFLEALGDDTNLVVVSDHGYDFVNDNHVHAPPGVLFARGPAFEAGARVDSLSVYDVAPLVLRLLDLPLPLDMPGTRTRAYERALSSGFLDQHPLTEIETYEGGGEATQEEPVESPKDEEMLDALRSLGYIG